MVLFFRSLMVAFAGSRNNVPQRLSRRPSRNPRWELQKVGAPLFADSEFNMTSGTISSPWNGRSFWSCSFRWRTSVDSDDRLISRRGRNKLPCAEWMFAVVGRPASPKYCLRGFLPWRPTFWGIARRCAISGLLKKPAGPQSLNRMPDDDTCRRI